MPTGFARPSCQVRLGLSRSVFPDHDHGGRVELAVAHELATDGAAGGLVAGGEAVTKVLVGAHGAGAVLDDVEVVQLGEVEAAVG